MRKQKEMLNAYKDVKIDKQNLNKQYKTLVKGTNQNGTIGVEYPNEIIEDSTIYGYQNKKIQNAVKN